MRTGCYWFCCLTYCQDYGVNSWEAKQLLEQTSCMKMPSDSKFVVQVLQDICSEEATKEIPGLIPYFFFRSVKDSAIKKHLEGK